MSPTFFNISILNSRKIMGDLCGDRAPCHPRLTLLPHTLPLLLRMESTGGNSIRAHFLAVAGVSEAEIRRTHQVLGPLDELKVSILVKGPFKVSLRKMPCEHLTFSTSDNQSTVGILELEAVLEAYIPQRCGLSTCRSLDAYHLTVEQRECQVYSWNLCIRTSCFLHATHSRRRLVNLLVLIWISFEIFATDILLSFQICIFKIFQFTPPDYSIFNAKCESGALKR